jgi:hypothetical protein
MKKIFVISVLLILSGVLCAGAATNNDYCTMPMCPVYGVDILLTRPSAVLRQVVQAAPLSTTVVEPIMRILTVRRIMVITRQVIFMRERAPQALPEDVSREISSILLLPQGSMYHGRC